jgi:alkaline phosphatase D
MSISMRLRASMTRRRFLAGAATAVATEVVAKPYLSRAPDRPVITHGIQSGDVSADGGVVWARADQPARMLVEVSTTESFRTIRASQLVDVLPETDCTAKVLLEALPPGQDIFYRISFQSHSFPTIVGESRTGRFRTAPGDRRDVSFVWSADTAGQGWGIDRGRGGMRTYATMLRGCPDFFIHCGDSIYADCPIAPRQVLPNGEVWSNVVTEEKSTVAETLSDFRGNYKYNLLDENVLAFNAQVPIFAQWDDHEVTNDWCPGEDLPESYSEASLLELIAYGNRAFHEFMPMRDTMAEAGRIYRKIAYGPLLDVFMLDMRSYRSPNSEGREARILGAAQLAWLKRELLSSRATWKVISADLPIGVVSADAVALGDGAPQEREIEIADLLSFIKHARVRNTVWITGDMHYTAAHYYDPNLAVFADFEPFWEFISGPLHAGTWGPGKLDNTFGPRAIFQKGASEAQGENLAPCFGLQFFGHVAIDGTTEVMTVTLKDVDDRALWATRIEPSLQRWSRQSAIPPRRFTAAGRWRGET